MNEGKFGSRKIFILKYSRTDQIIQKFSKIGSTWKLDPPSLICRNFKTVRKKLLIHPEYIEI